MMTSYFFEAIKQVDIVLAAKSAINKAKSLYFFEKSGLSIINQLIQNCLGNYIQDSFVEYSFISSTLDKNMPGLSCFSLITDKSGLGMLQNIETYCSSIIRGITARDGYSIYHHPDLFMAPMKSDACDLVNLSFSDELCSIFDYQIEKDARTVYWQVPKRDYYVQNMSFKRSYEQMIDNARSINVGDINISVNEAHRTLHSLYQTYFVGNTEDNNSVSCYISIPIIGASSSNMLPRNIIRDHSKQGQGAIFIFFTLTSDSVNKLEQTKINIKSKIEELFVSVNFITHCYSVNYLFNLGLQLQNDAQTEAIKSAISAIMARNMSHNLGSHFISNTKHYFSNLAEIDTDEQRQKDYRGIRHTLQYIQERMDFIATIVSTDRFPYGPVNVKSQIFDELTPDEFGDRHDKATTNFLLDYIVFSEDISKQSNLSSSSIKLSLKLISDNGIKFGGQNKQENQEAKEEFAKLNLAVPGGILGRHAIFTIIENVIRNSAKHDKESIPEDGLTVSIKIGKDHLVIFDNKKNANKEIKKLTLREELNERYAKIKILSDGTIDKSNKGLKEILISALWLNNHSLADWFGEYESIPRKDKIEKLSEVLRIVAVDDNGDITTNGENLGYYITLKEYEKFYYIKDYMVVDDKINYSSISRIKADIIVANKDYEVVIDGNTLQNKEDDIDSNAVLRLSNLYPRFYENRGGGKLPQVEEMMKKIIERNTGITVEELSDINIHIEPKDYTFLSNTSDINHCIWHVTGEATGIRKNDILFKNHLSVLKTEEIDRVLAAYSDAGYIDSISGGDFTGTITQPFFLEEEFNRLKVLESALTEFVIIDERIFKNYGHGIKKTSGSSKPEINKLLLDADKIFNEVEKLLALGKSCDNIGDHIGQHYHIELHVATLMKNDKVLIREDIEKKVAQKNSEIAPKTEKTESDSDNFMALHKMIEKRRLHIYDIDKDGNVINLEGEPVANVTNNTKKLCLPTFLSIHLSIIEKIAKENNMRASEVMKNLKTIFGDTKFITIHSGRGNLSAELEEELKDYAFLSLSAIQAAMDDSKYFLSQLLYNNCYIGKGRLNHK